MPDFLKILKKRKVIILIVVAIAIVVVVMVRIRSNGTVETVSPIVGDLVRTVKISGKVAPKESVDLGFEISGIVTSTTRDVGQIVKSGDVLVRIDASSISAEILKAEAELALTLANLKKLDGAGVYEAQIENAKRAIIQTIINTYAISDDAVHNKTDQLFLNPRTNRPEISYAINNYDLSKSINRNRIAMGETLNAWKSLITGLDLSTYTEKHLSTSREYLSEVSSYISDITRAVNLFEATSWLSQSTIDGYKSDVVSARDNLNTSSQNLISAEDKLKGLLLEVPVQVARVETARAALANFRSQLTKTALISPIEGVVSKQEAKVGQVAPLNTSVVSVISKSLEIESYVPEVLISGVEIGNSASVTLDAYSDGETFEALVVQVDPAETIRDGVSTYKVRLAFSKPDERIRSGMTANINIETFRKKGVKLIPERTILREDKENFVYILSDDGSETKRAIVTGERDSSGNVELISELPTGSRLITNPTEN